MKSKSLFQALPIAAAVAAMGVLGTAEHAQAGAYAISYNEITNLIVTPSAGWGIVLPSSVNSNAQACLPNAVCAPNGGGAGVTDANPSQIGVALANNNYTPVGIIPSSYARADASIDSQQTLGAPFTRVRAISEGYLFTNGTANANSGNSSATVQFRVSTTTTGTLNFQFDADPFVRALLHANSIVPSNADATIAVSITMRNQATQQEVFRWNPDGGVGGITGGVENLDSFSLNTTLAALPIGIGPFTHDPANCAIGSIITGCFNATTNALGAGVYILQLSMETRMNLQKTTREVPEPATLGLLGLGLGVLGFLGRRKHAA